MTPDELRAIMDYLRERVCLGKNERPVTVTFNPPTEEAMLGAGLNAEGVRRILGVTWWDEMVTDIVETPELCGTDSREEILGYARDVISEYIRKRFPLE